MKNTLIVKSLSIFTSLSVILCSIPAGAASPAAAPMPDFVKALTPPETLGYVDSYFKGESDHPVVLIEDLHANYGVQKKIRSILEFMQPLTAPTGRPMILGIEGAWGNVNLDFVRSEPMKIRRADSDFLLKNSEISAMEHFAALSESDVHLVGIDDPEDYIVHTQLFRESLAARLSLAQKTDKLREAINSSKGDAPQALRRIWRLEESFHLGQIDLPELSQKLGVSISTYKEAEVALSRAKAALVDKEDGQKGFFLRNLVEADKNLALLGRLLREQLTLEEVQYASKQMPAMLMTVRAMLPGESIELWNDTIRSAIDHYAIALLRNKPMAAHALELVRTNPDTSVVIVTGGFHTAGIASILKQHNTSYVVIAPIVESHTAKDEAVYVKRMMDIHVTDAEIAAAVNVRPGAQTMIPMFAYVVRGVASIPRQIYQRVSDVYPRLQAARGRGQAVPAPSAQEAADNMEVTALTKATDPQMPPNPVFSFLSSVGRYLGLVKGLEEIEVPVTPPSVAKDASSFSLGGRLAVKATAVVTAVAAVATLSQVKLAALTLVTTSNAVNPGVSSHPFLHAAAIATTLIAVGMAGYINRQKIAQRMQQGMQQARDALVKTAA